MGKQVTLRQQAIALIAAELPAGCSTDDAYATAYRVMQQSGLRRAMWSMMSLEDRRILTRRAMAVARSVSA